MRAWQSARKTTDAFVYDKACWNATMMNPSASCWEHMTLVHSTLLQRLMVSQHSTQFENDSFLFGEVFRWASSSKEFIHVHWLQLLRWMHKEDWYLEEVRSNIERCELDIVFWFLQLGVLPLVLISCAVVAILRLNLIVCIATFFLFIAAVFVPQLPLDQL